MSAVALFIASTLGKHDRLLCIQIKSGVTVTDTDWHYTDTDTDKLITWI